MSNIIFRYESSKYTFTDIVRPNYPNNSGIKYHTDLLQNPEYSITNRDLPETNITLEISDIKQTARNLIWTLWNTTLNHGNYLFTIIDHKKRMLFDVFWPQWKERWQKTRGGIYSETLDLQSAYPWTPPLFAFYPFISSDTSMTVNCHSTDSNSSLIPGTGYGTATNTILLNQGIYSNDAAHSTTLSWFQQKDSSSISFITQFRTGEIEAGSEINIIRLTDGSNTLRLYVKNVDTSSSQGLSSSAGLSSEGYSSSLGLSSSSSLDLSSSIGLSSSSLHKSESSSSSIGLSSSSMNLSSSSLDLSSSSMGLSSSSMDLSSSSSIGLSSSSSAGLSSSGGDSSSQGLSSVGSSYSSASTSSVSVSSSSSIGLSSSSSDAAYSSSSGESTAQMTIAVEWTRSGSSAEIISQEDINVNSNGVRAWYDICCTFDNENNIAHLYICKSGETSKVWSYTNNFLYGTTNLSSIPENSIVSSGTSILFPENITWTSLYLLEGTQPTIYTDSDEKAELKYAMIVDEFIPPIEFNLIRRLFHYWNVTGGNTPK